MEEKLIKSGFISIIGRPNVGKSTLLNELVGNKLSIVTQKANTTRNKILGILTSEDYQMIFMDTPGIHSSKNEFGNMMNRTSFSTLKSADIVLLMVPANEIIGTNDNLIIEHIKKVNKPIILVISKIDTVTLTDLEVKKDEWINTGIKFIDIVSISTLEKVNIDRLKKVIYDNLPTENNGIKFYPDDRVTDQPDRFIVKEIVREQVLLQIQDEIPFSTAVLTEEFKDTKDGLKISVAIVVDKKSHKGILIGKNGSRIKEIGIHSREQLQNIFGTKVHLTTFVKVEPKWQQSASLVKKMGYDKDSY